MEIGKNQAVGRICVWQGGSVWVSRSSGVVDTHDHHAIQITLALEGTLQLRTPADPAWRTYTAAVIPCHQPHALNVLDTFGGLIFVDPEAHEGRALTERFGREGIVALPDNLAGEAIAVLAAACRGPLYEQALIDAAREVVRILTAGAQPRTVVDPRILKAIELVQERLPRPVVQEEIAEAVFLSPSRFRHLFVEQTGMAFRPYVLWLRLHRALACYTAGKSLTQAAAVAGFADVAHLSRTFRRMFGVNPGRFEQTGAFPPGPSPRA